MKNKQWDIRQLRESQPETARIKLRWILASGLSGLVLGFLAAHLEPLVDSGGALPAFLSWLNELFSRLGIWVFTALLLSIFCKSSAAAIRNAGLFFSGRLLGYVLYGLILSGTFSGNFLLLGLLSILVGPAWALLAWYGKGEGFPSLLLASLSTGLLLQQSIGISLAFFSFKHIEELVLFALLLLAYRRPAKQALILCGVSIVVAFFLEHLDFLSA